MDRRRRLLFSILVLDRNTHFFTALTRILATVVRSSNFATLLGKAAKKLAGGR